MENRNLVIAICLLDENDNIVSKKKLEAKWSIEIENEMKSMFALDMEEEVAYIMFDEIKRSLTKETIKDLLNGM